MATSTPIDVARHAETARDPLQGMTRTAPQRLPAGIAYEVLADLRAAIHVLPVVLGRLSDSMRRAAEAGDTDAPQPMDLHELRLLLTGAADFAASLDDHLRDAMICIAPAAHRDQEPEA